MRSRRLTAALLCAAMFGAACGTTNNTQKAAKDYGDISSDAKTELDASGPTV
ncbi:MAG: hypothetical protein QOF21_3249, partial [Actinomycetota bacterium]